MLRSCKIPKMMPSDANPLRQLCWGFWLDLRVWLQSLHRWNPAWPLHLPMHETCNSLSDFKCRFPSVPSMATCILKPSFWNSISHKPAKYVQKSQNLRNIVKYFNSVHLPSEPLSGNQSGSLKVVVLWQVCYYKTGNSTREGKTYSVPRVSKFISTVILEICICNRLDNAGNISIRSAWIPVQYANLTYYHKLLDQEWFANFSKQLNK